MKYLLLAVCVAVSACSGSPTAQTQTQTTAPPPAPVIQPANVIAQGSLTLTVCGPTLGCNFSGTIQNTGTGCAGTVRGTTTTSATQGGPTVDQVQWFGPSRLRPNESFVFSGCCLHQTNGFSRSIASWDNIACS